VEPRKKNFAESRAKMRIKQVLWLIAAFGFVGVLYAQRAQMPSAPPAMSGPQMGAQSQMQTVEKEKSQAQGPVPLTEKEVVKEIKSASAETVIKDVKARGVDFDMTPSIEKKLRKAQATDEVIEAVRRGGPTVRANTRKLTMGPGEGGAQEFPKEQVQALDAIKSELDPERAIALAEDFSKKYPDSGLLPYAYFFEANGYQQKGDVEKVVEYTGKGLKMNPNNLACLIMRAEMLPQPQYLNNHAAEREKILQEAESESKHALELIAQIPKQPNEADADYQKRLASTAAQVHGALGMVHLEMALASLAGVDKAELAKAEQEFTAAVTTTDRPEPQDYFRMGEAYGMDGKLDDAIQAFGKASELGQGTMIKTIADQRLEEMKKRKAQGSAPPSPK
jgi:tetratricopeptide (TPR) repeat protein